MEKMLVYPVIRWGRQWCPADGKSPLLTNEGKVKVKWDDVRNRSVSLKETDLINHFSAEPYYADKWLSAEDRVLYGRKTIPAIWGSFGCALRFTQNIVKAIGIDADNEDSMNLLHEYFIPQLKYFEVNYVEEYSGSNNNRGHLWIPTPGVDVRLSTAFLNQIRDNVGFKPEEWFNEQYPYGNRTNALFRLPFGLYLKTMEVKWGNYNGVDFDNLEDGLLAFINAKPLTEEKLLSLLKEKPREKKVYQVPAKVLIPKELSTVDFGELEPNLPVTIDKISRKCQALRGVITGCKDRGILNDTTGLGHNTGLFLSGIAQYNDFYCKDTTGKEWYKDFITKYRRSDEGDHNWTYYWGKKKSVSRIFPSCKTFQETFNMCDGCPFLSKIKNPRQLLEMEEIERKKVGDIRIASLEAIREEVFTQLDTEIDVILENNTTANILVEAVQNSGKSVWADRLAVRLSQQGKKVCISCNSAVVALEHKQRIEFNEDGTPTGEKAFIMFSYESIFEHFSGGVLCPYTTEIKDLRQLGVDSTYYKKKYCKTCPFIDRCNYPKQYSQVHDEKYKIVIIQHAHLSCSEVIRQLFQKHFNCLIIDETFIDQLTTQIIPSKQEVEILKTFEAAFPWVKSLLNWMTKGGIPDVLIKPYREHLRPILEAFKEAKELYRLDQFIRLFNEGVYMHPSTGVMRFIPLPNVDIRIFTDATPTTEELEIVLNTTNIQRIGAGIVVDPTIYHPDNKVFQILDGRTSKAALLKREELWEYLEDIGDKMRHEYDGLTALIVVHKEAELDAFEFMARNYPDVLPRIAISHMAVGTNEWAAFNIQFILAGPYLNTRMIMEQSYKLKFIYNYWSRLEDRPLIHNAYPIDIPDDASSEYFVEPVCRIHKDGIYEYPQFNIYTPDPESFEYLVYKRLRGKKQQAMRIRHKIGKKTIVYFYDNDYLPSILVTDVFTKNDILGRIRE